MRPLDPDTVVANLCGVTTAGLASALRDVDYLVKISQRHEHAGLHHLALLAKTNRLLWDAEIAARCSDLPDAELGRLKREIDNLNSQRFDQVEFIDSLFREALNPPSLTSLPLHDSPGQILDRLSIECLRANALSQRRHQGGDDDKELRLAKATEQDIEALIARLWEITDAVLAGRRFLRPSNRKKLY